MPRSTKASAILGFAEPATLLKASWLPYLKLSNRTELLAQPRNGVNYNVAVQSPQYRVDTLQDLQIYRSPPRGNSAARPILANLVSSL